MTTLIDARFDALRALGHNGSMSDMVLLWLQDNGAISDNIVDAWREMLLTNLLEETRFSFNGSSGTPDAVSTQTLFAGFEGAIACNFVLLNDSINRDIMGDNTWIRVRATPNTDLRVQLFGDAGNFNALSVTLGVIHGVSMDWPVGPADGKITLDGNSGPKPQGVAAAISNFSIGRAQGANAAFFGPIWDVRIYSDEAQSVLTHHWPMNEGSGNTFIDIVGGDDIVFDPGIGSWIVLGSVVNPLEYHRNDFWYELLGEQGHTGAMADRELQFWLAGGIFV